jgi:DNA-binding response OmpR family regulator
MAVNILQIAYYPALLEARELILEKEGYDVVSVLGNDQGIALARTKTFDLIVLGFSAPHPVRSAMLRWLKQHLSQTPVVALLAHEAERLPEADYETLSEDPRIWLATVESCINRRA